VNPEQWSRVKRHFSDALELPAEERTGWEARLAAEEPEVRTEVDALMQSHAEAADFMAAPILVDPADIAEVLDSDPPAAAAVSLPPGTRIGDYEIRREIGRGGMGVVYLAQDVHLARPVALKALPVFGPAHRRLVDRLRREAQAAAAISHPGIATVYAFLETPGGYFIASEFIQGRTLRQELQIAAIEPSRAVRLAMEIARALCAAHDAHVVHRDLKPENILITTGGAVKVIDFGIAQIERADLPPLTVQGLLQGTPGYMAPEQLVAGAPVDARADVYALGVILSEMLLGHHPFQSSAGKTPPALQAIIQRCLHADSGRRYRSARDLLHDLERVSLALDGMSSIVASPAGLPHRRGSMFWWQFHQGLCAAIYGAMAVPVWYARETLGGLTGPTLFFVSLGALLLASILRLHLWFTSHFDREDLAEQARRERPWIVVADLVFSATLIVGGLLTNEAWQGLSVLLLAVGIGAAVVALFIEPATARAALQREQRT